MISGVITILVEVKRFKAKIDVFLTRKNEENENARQTSVLQVFFLLRDNSPISFVLED